MIFLYSRDIYTRNYAFKHAVVAETTSSEKHWENTITAHRSWAQKNLIVLG